MRWMAPIGVCAIIVNLGVFCGCGRHEASRSVVGVFGGRGLGPGRFHYPRAIAAAPDGRVFVVDKTGRVQRFAPDGTLERHWHMPDTSRGYPVGISVHPDGRVFVADTHCHRVLIFDREGRPLAEFGREGMGDGEFQLPTDVAFDASGFIYVSEYYLNDRVTTWTPRLRFVRAIGEEPIEGKRLSRPSALAVDEEQTLWVADACNHRLVRFSLDGRVLACVGDFGREPGRLRYPYDLAITDDGALLVCEYEGARLQWFSREGRSLRTWGRPGRRVGELFAPWGAAVGPDGRVYVVDSLNDRVQILDP